MKKLLIKINNKLNIFKNIIKAPEKKSKVYFSYDDAINECGTYEDTDLIKVIAAKGKVFVKSLHQNNFLFNYDFDNFQIKRLVNLISMFDYQKKELCILDFGGGIGQHFYLIKHLINPKINLNWIVFETKELTNECKELGLENTNLNFVSSFEEIEKFEFDVIYSNYALSYAKDPHKYLQSILNLDFQKFYMTNTSIGEFDKEYIVGIQHSDLKTNGVGREIPEYLGIPNKEIKYPFTIMNKTYFEKIINQNSEIIYIVKEQESAYMTLEGDFDLYGILVEKRNK